MYYEHRHYQLRDGRWASRVRIVQIAGDDIRVSDYCPGGTTAGIFATEREAIAYNAQLASTVVARF